MSQPLRGKKILITAGPTREYWDPVRFITNASSGAMGIALAQEAHRLGASVALVLGPIPRFQVPRFRSLKVIPIVSAWDMYEAVKKHLPGTAIFIGAAAVVDYRPAHPAQRKIKRHTPSLSLRLYGNPDIIALVGHLQKGRPSTVVGFALETDHVLENARRKLQRKNMDWIVANRETSMGSAMGEATLLSHWGDKVHIKKMPKERLAKKIWRALLSHE